MTTQKRSLSFLLILSALMAFTSLFYRYLSARHANHGKTVGMVMQNLLLQGS